MTIYKPKGNDRKADKKDSSATKVVISEDVEPLALKAKTVEPPVHVLIFPVASNYRRRQRAALACLLLLVLVLIFAVGFAAFFIYHQHMTPKKTGVVERPHVETAEVRYYEYQTAAAASEDDDDDEDEEDGGQHRIDGLFSEEIEMDTERGTYERLNVPPILQSRRSTVVHDFERNLTAIVDRDNARCFVMPMDRSTVQPPKSFLDLLIKYKSGYYLPDAQIVRDNFKVQLPAVTDLEPFGIYIWYDCRTFQTYLLVHDDTPTRSIVKREACEMAGESFCLGDTGADKMMCFTLSGCA
jgi:integral membrane protein 2B